MPLKIMSLTILGDTGRYDVLVYENANYVEDLLTVGQGVAYDTAMNNTPCILIKEC